MSYAKRILRLSNELENLSKIPHILRATPITSAILNGIEWEKRYSPQDDGVYIDVSRQPKYGIIVAVVCICQDRQKTVSFFAATNKTEEGEQEGIRIAKILYPEEIVYCDHLDSCLKQKCAYIDRRQNPAHRAARNKTNFRNRK